MNLLPEMFGGTLPTSMKLVLLTILLVVILILIFWAIRLATGKPVIKPVRDRLPRLAVIDAANLDNKRRLVLIRRDDVEHLVMIGGASDILIEENIIRTIPNQVRSPLLTDPAPVSDLAPVSDATPDRPTDTPSLPHVPKATPATPAGVLSGIATATELTSKKDEAAITAAEIGPIDENLNLADQVSSDELNSEMLSSLEDALGVELIDNKATIAANNVAPPISTHSPSDLGPSDLGPSVLGPSDLGPSELVQNQMDQGKPEISVAAAQPELATDKNPSSVTPDRQSNKEDQMQKLLDELTGGTS